MNAIISSLRHFEHFVLNHPKTIPIRRSAEKSVTLLIVLVFRAAVVTRGKKGKTVLVFVAFVCDAKVAIETVLIRSGLSFQQCSFALSS